MISRSDLSQYVPLDSAVLAKSSVLEVHAEDPLAYLSDIAGRGNVEQTGDAFLSRVFVPSPASSGLALQSASLADRDQPHWEHDHQHTPGTRPGRRLPRGGSRMSAGG